MAQTLLRGVPDGRTPGFIGGSGRALGKVFGRRAQKEGTHSRVVHKGPPDKIVAPAESTFLPQTLYLESVEVEYWTIKNVKSKA